MGKVTPIAIDGVRMQRKFNIILNEDKFQSEAASKFMDFLDVDNINSILRH